MLISLGAGSWLFADSVIPDTTLVTFKNLEPEPQHRRVSQTISQILTQYHYLKKAIDDSMSSQIYDRYLESLDPNRLYFLSKDIQHFERFRYMFDDFVNSGQLFAPFDIFNTYQKRVAERLQYVFRRIDQPFDFTIDEFLDYDRENAPWPDQPAELDELWRKRLKNEALSLKLAGKDQEGIVSTLRKRYKRMQKNVAQSQSEDVFQILMNAFSESFDPHTNYFSPKEFDDFKIRMSQSLEGIGARLVNENDYTKVVEIVPGGPADKSKLLHPNDKIVGVAQGYDGEVTDVVGWRIDDVVQLIRGKKNTIVRLQVIPADAAPGSQPDTIALVRDKIKLEDQSAKADTVRIMHNGQEMVFGVITIPTFYSDFDAMRRGEKDYKSTTRDVARLLGELKEQNVDGVIIDLRRNGGGYLNEAVDLTGLFIDRGPVVQVRDTNGRIDVERDQHPGLVYSGPLAVMVDRLSASASEIFAAAIQDYNRGLIIGSQSYGKGTVQRPIDLNRFVRDPNLKLGQIKLTIAKFYRVDGRSTQHDGVQPDISFPSRLGLMDIGESSQPNALVWDHIKGIRHADFEELSGILPQLNKQHMLRLSHNREYEELLAEIDEYKKLRDQKHISLNEISRRAEMEKKKRKKDENAEEAENKKDDLLMTESAHVLGDYITLKKNN